MLRLESARPAMRACLWILAAGLIALAFQLDPEQEHKAALFLAGAGSIGIVAAALTPTGLSVWLLELPLVQWLGKVSYSLYLIHVPIIVAMLHLAAGALPLPVVVPLAIVIAFAAAAAMQRYVEASAQKLGRRLAKPLLSRPPAVDVRDRRALGHPVGTSTPLK